MRLDPSPIPKGKHTANSNRAYLSPDTIVSISGHILFIRSSRLAEASRERNDRVSCTGNQGRVPHIPDFL